MRALAITVAAIAVACAPTAALLCQQDGDCAEGVCDATGQCRASPAPEDGGTFFDGGAPVDGGAEDAGRDASVVGEGPDGGPDAGALDGGVVDAGPVDAGPVCALDGVKAEGEPCDDGNLDDGDGCSSACEVEIGWRCVGPLGETSRCAPSSRCPQNQRRIIALSFAETTNLPAGIIAGGEVAADEVRFSDLGGQGIVDVGISAGLSPRSNPNYALFDPEGGYRVRFFRAGTQVPIAVMDPRVLLVDLESSDAMGPFTFAGWGRGMSPPYTIANIFSGLAEPVGDEWVGTSPALGGVIEAAEGVVDLTGFAVSDFGFAPSSAGSTIGLRFIGDEIVVCDFAGCGDGVITNDETCDDGNRLDGDGCSEACQLE